MITRFMNLISILSIVHTIVFLFCAILLFIVQTSFSEAQVNNTRMPAQPNSSLSNKWSDLSNTNLIITYQDKIFSEYTPIYKLLKEQEALEQISAFLAPLRLPTKLKITLRQCRYSFLSQAYTGAYYSFINKEVVVCYEEIQAFSSAGHDIKIRSGFTADDVTLGAFVNLSLHEIAHAIFDIYKLPVLGREEDAADQMATYIILTFGGQIAQRAIEGYANYVLTWDTPFTRANLSDEHSRPLQRYHNMICIAYGGSPDKFGRLAKMSGLSKERLAGCKVEYEQVRYAFDQTVAPHLDKQLLDKVSRIKWACGSQAFEESSIHCGIIVSSIQRC